MQKQLLRGHTIIKARPTRPIVKRIKWQLEGINESKVNVWKSSSNLKPAHDANIALSHTSTADVYSPTAGAHEGHMSIALLGHDDEG